MQAVVASPTSAPLVAFDLDGTLFDLAPGVVVVNYRDPPSVRNNVVPHAAACALVRASAGLRVAYLTARDEPLRRVTQDQVERAGLPRGPLLMQKEWLTPELSLSHKASALARLRDYPGMGPVALYVGDERLDEQAAVMARVPFLHATVFREVATRFERAGTTQGIPPSALLRAAGGDSIMPDWPQGPGLPAAAPPTRDFGRHGAEDSPCS